MMRFLTLYNTMGDDVLKKEKKYRREKEELRALGSLSLYGVYECNLQQKIEKYIYFLAKN